MIIDLVIAYATIIIVPRERIACTRALKRCSKKKFGSTYGKFTLNGSLHAIIFKAILNWYIVRFAIKK